MKKLISVLLGMSLFLGVFTFTSCEKGDSLFAGPINKWCEKTVEYTTDGENSQTVNLDVHLLYCNGSYDPAPKGVKVVENDKFNWRKKGLYMVVTQSIDNETLSIIANNKYSVLFFPEGDTVDENVDLESKFRKLKMSTWKWSLFCELNPIMSSEATSYLPECLRKANNYTEMTEGFSWKKIIAQILIDKLLKD